jgi:hypothetical protein
MVDEVSLRGHTAEPGAGSDDDGYADSVLDVGSGAATRRQRLSSSATCRDGKTNVKD